MDNQETQPKNTTFIPLAREIPKYRQAKLAGKRFAGPMRNIVSRYSDIHTTSSPLHSTKAQPIKGQPIIQPRTDSVQDVPNKKPAPQPQTTSTKASLPRSAQKGAVVDSLAKKAETELTRQSLNLEAKLKDKESKLAKLRGLEQERQQQLKGLTNQQKTAEAVIRNLKQQLENLSKNNLDKEQVDALKRKIAKKEQETIALKEEIEQLKNSLEQTNKLEAQIVNYRNQIIAMREQQKRLQELVKQSEAKLQELSSQLLRARQEKQSSESQIKKLEELLDNTIKSNLNPPKVHKKVVQASSNDKTIKLPILTKSPNAISGVVVDKNGKFIEGAVVLIKNVAGQNLRALRTNQLGQFVITTPLPSRKYYIDVSKPGHSFDIVEITLTGGIVPPVLIRSHEIAT